LHACNWGIKSHAKGNKVANIYSNIVLINLDLLKVAASSDRRTLRAVPWRRSVKYNGPPAGQGR